MGAVTALGNDVAVDLGGPARRAVRRPDDRRVRPVAARPSRIAGEVQDFDPSGVLDRKEHAADGPLHPVRRSSPRARRWTRPACPARLEGELAERTGVDPRAPGSAASGRSSTTSRSSPTRGPDRISPFLIPMGIPNVGAGPGRDQLRDDRAELRDGVGLRDRRPRDRRGVRDRSGAATPTSCSPAASEAGDLRAARRRVRRDAGPLDAQRRPGGGVAAVRQGPRRLRDRRGRRRRSCSRSSATPRRAARDRSPSSSATARPPTPRTSRCRRPGGIGAVRAARRALEKAGMDAGRDRPRERPCDLDARGRQGRAPGDPDDLRRPRADGRRSRPTSRCSATRSARRARSRRSSRS